jgi:hypothetical protein
MPDDPLHLTLLDAHEFDYDRRLFPRQTQLELEQRLAGLTHHGYSGQNVGEVVDLLCDWLAGQFPVRFSVLADEHAANLRQALDDCLFDWHLDLGSAPSTAEYWAGLAPEILKRAVFTLAPERFDFGPARAASQARRAMNPERDYVAAELRHPYRDLLPYALARVFAWEFFHKRYPRQAADAPLKVEDQVCETVCALLEGWRESHQGRPMVETNPLRGVTSAARAELIKTHGDKVLVLDESCEQIAIPVVRIFHIALNPQSYRLPPLWRYCLAAEE